VDLVGFHLSDYSVYQEFDFELRRSYQKGSAGKNPAGALRSIAR
jgi:hypothetical protein